MPFDGRNAILATRESLAAAIAVGRVEAVDPYVLDGLRAEHFVFWLAGRLYGWTNDRSDPREIVCLRTRRGRPPALSPIMCSGL